jgi:hypothetical protein
MKTMRFLTTAFIAAGFFFIASCETECPELIDPAYNDSIWNPADTTGTNTDTTWNGGTDSTVFDGGTGVPGDSTNTGGGGWTDSTWIGGSGGGVDTTGWGTGDSTNFGG